MFHSMDYAAAPPALKEAGAASEIINDVLSTLEMNDVSDEEALNDIQEQLKKQVYCSYCINNHLKGEVLPPHIIINHRGKF